MVTPRSDALFGDCFGTGRPKPAPPRHAMAALSLATQPSAHGTPPPPPSPPTAAGRGGSSHPHHPLSSRQASSFQAPATEAGVGVWGTAVTLRRADSAVSAESSFSSASYGPPPVVTAMPTLARHPLHAPYAAPPGPQPPPVAATLPRPSMGGFGGGFGGGGSGGYVGHTNGAGGTPPPYGDVRLLASGLPVPASVLSAGGRPPPAHAGSGRRALLVGINYRGAKTLPWLEGCVNDVRLMHFLLTSRFGYRSRDMWVMTDEPDGINAPVVRLRPTRRNILNGLHWLSGCAVSGDCLFFHFSGHGGQVRWVSRLCGVAAVSGQTFVVSLSGRLCDPTACTCNEQGECRTATLGGLLTSELVSMFWVSAHCRWCPRFWFCCPDVLLCLCVLSNRRYKTWTAMKRMAWTRR